MTRTIARSLFWLSVIVGVWTITFGSTDALPQEWIEFVGTWPCIPEWTWPACMDMEFEPICYEV